MTYDRLATALGDRYRIERELGAGGMATVYLAADLKHDRKVAIKVLKPELAAVLGAERFVQEIKTTAALSHPHILPLFDSGEAGGFLYYVMPFIEGETIRDRLNRETQLGIDEAVKIAAEVADALHYAHRHGVIHRDIKPENILLHDGRPMVMDFGIALAVSAAAGGRMTETGLSLGTPHYMSPEQATADKTITARSDVYSLASVLYEMLAGEPPHTGGSAQAIIMKIIAERAQPVTELRSSVPPHVAAALAKALEKLPADRFGSAHEFSEALADTTFRAVAGERFAVAGPATGTGWLTPRTIALVAAGLVVGFGSHALLSRGEQTSAPVMRALIPLDSGVAFSGNTGNAGRPTSTRVALSPDGRTLVLAARGPDGTQRLYARPLAASSATAIDGTDGAFWPTFSPDGKDVAFFASGRLRRVPLAGGTPVDVTALVGDPGGASWGDDGYIVFRDLGRDGLARVPAAGGSAVEALASHPDARLPFVLPGSRAVLYSVRYDGLLTQRRVEALHLGKARIDTIIDNASDARYSRTGHLLFARVGTLMAVAFDPSTLRVSGAPTGILSSVMHSMNGWNTAMWTDAAQYAISDAGHLAYLEGGVTPSQRNDVALMNRKGDVTPLGIERSGYLVARLSPAGDRLAVAAPGEDGGVWTIDLRRGNAVRRIARGSVPGVLWSRDAREILYNQDPRGNYRIPFDGSSAPTRFDTSGVWSAELTPDGKDVISVDNTGAISLIVSISATTGEHRTLVEEPAGASWPTLSPDGRWLAYVLGDASELVVRSWPDLGQRTVVAGPEAYSPAWSRGGRELFYVQDPTGPSDTTSTHLAIRSFDPSTGVAGDPVTIPLPANFRSMGPVRSYDVTTDGQRIAFILQGAEVTPPPRQVHIVLNWASTLQP